MLKEKIILDYLAIVEVAKLAGETIMSIYNDKTIFVKHKDDKSPLTIADEKSHQIIVKELEKYGIPILSEEGKNISYEERQNWELYWLIDPLDGTKEFIKKNGEFTVNIALIEKNKPVFGVVSLPVTGEVYVGGENFKGRLIIDNKEQPLFSKEENTCENILVASRSHLSKETEDYINALENPTMIQVGSSLKFMMLTRNKASVYPRFGPTMEWDIAASHAVLLSLGYKIENQEKEELTYNKENLLNPYFIAY